MAGVSYLTALAYLLTLEDPARFRKSREVGPALGLIPKQDQSGDRDPQLRITPGLARQGRLAVLLHRLWKTGESYDPFYRSHTSADPPAALSAGA